MARRVVPERSAGFAGVDFAAEPERIGVAGFSRLENMRVDRDGNLRRLPGLPAAHSSRSLSLDGGTAAVQLPNGNLAVARTSATALTVLEYSRDVSQLGGQHAVTLTGDIPDRIFMVAFHGYLYVAAGAVLARFTLSSSGALTSTRETLFGTLALGDDAQPVGLRFTGIAAFNGHLVGWGFGDGSDEATVETGRLGPDRPDIIRWSQLGAPHVWPAANWISIGRRGNAVRAVLPAFGRLLVLKEAGAHLLYGNLEANFPQSEPLRTDDAVPTGCTGPFAACVYDNSAWWMSSQGPLAWDGSPTVTLIGRQLDGEWESSDLSKCAVVPVPRLQSVGYLFRYPAETRMYLFDTNWRRWSGMFRWPAREILAPVPFQDDTGAYDTLFYETSGTKDYLARLDDDTAVAGSATTGAAVVPGQRGGVPRGTVFTGQWQNAGGGFSAAVPGQPARPSPWLATPPASPSEGDRWYARGTDPAWPEGQYEYTGTEHVPVANVPPGLLLIDWPHGAAPRQRFHVELSDVRWHPDFRLNALAVEYLD